MDDAIALRAMDIYYEYSLRVQVRSKSPSGEWGDLRFSGDPIQYIRARRDNGEIKFGRIRVRSKLSGCTPSRRVHIRGPWGVGIAWRVAFIVG